MAQARTHERPYNIQAPAEKYRQSTYLSPERLSSIGYQFRLAAETGGSSFLNVGSAHGLLELLLQRAGYRVIGLDLDHDVLPAIVGVLPRLPFRDRCVDVVMAFQILEHMPIEMLEDCLLELRRVATDTVLISLPDQTQFQDFRPSSSRLESLAIRFHQWTWERQKWRFEISTPLDPEHFWEIGHDNITHGSIVAVALNSGLKLVRSFRNPCLPYHAFFVFQRAGR